MNLYNDEIIKYKNIYFKQTKSSDKCFEQFKSEFSKNLRFDFILYIEDSLYFIEF